MTHPLSVHAIYPVLNETEFFIASVRSVYPFVTGITVTTTYDRDRFGRPVTPEGVIETIFDRVVDPDRKLNLIITTEYGEPGPRNRAIAYASRSAEVVRLPGEPERIPPPDIFWHVDADEIYDPGDVPALFEWVAQSRAQVVRMHWRTYFRTWNWWTESPGEGFVAFTRPSFRFGYLRDRRPTLYSRAVRRAQSAGLLSRSGTNRLLRVAEVPRDVAVCHHGSYVGDRDRIATKLDRSGHRHEIRSDWLERCWDGWHPEMTNFHPVNPPDFPSLHFTPTDELPRPIRDHNWPAGWIDRAS